jgi:hypothetical protein
VALTNLDGRGALRIPLTVGDIYGRSGLPDLDDLAHGGKLPVADLAVECRGGTAALIGGTLEGGRAKVALDAPIDLEVSGWAPRNLVGRAADGRTVTLRIEPMAGGEAPLDLAILVDHSGSMQEACAGDRLGVTKHDAAVEALGRLARTVGKRDMVDLWEFDDALTFLGSTRPGEKRQADLGTLVRALSGPRGGTEIGGALDRVLTQSKARDVLLITDGKSHALDVQALAQRGRRIAAVLVGEDSLEANVGHLAALTGGEIFVVAGADLIAAMEGAVRSLRVPHQAAVPIEGSPQSVKVRRAGMLISAAWQSDQATEDTSCSRAIAATAASLALPALPADSAAAFAEAEGLVTHLTSLILVDEAATQEDSIPATRKVALPTPRTAAMRVMAAAPSMDGMSRPMMRFSKKSQPASGSIPDFDWAATGQSNEEAVRPTKSPAGRAWLAPAMDWDQAPHRLQAGDLAELDPAIARAIRELAARPDVIDVANKLKLDPLVLVIGLLARMQADRNRSAARIARAIFGKRPRREIDEAAAMAGIM